MGGASARKRQRRNELRERIAILVGAGASAGAGAVSPDTPPLGGELYARLVREYPETWGKLPSDLHDLFSTPGLGFELGTSQLWDAIWAEGQPIPANLLIDMAIYFTRFHLDGDQDCYSKLVEILTRRGFVGKTAFASLNYECLLEMAISRSGLGFDHLVERLPPRNLLVLKPHGSCNFMPTLQVWNLSVIASSIYEGPIDVVTNLAEVARRYAAGFALPPAMSLFAPGKRTPVARTMTDKMRAQWARWARDARVVVVIGTRPVLADEHVWTPIVESNAEVWYVGHRSGADFDVLRERLGSRFVLLASSFREGLGALEEHLAHLS